MKKHIFNIINSFNELVQNNDLKDIQEVLNILNKVYGVKDERSL